MDNAAVRSLGLWNWRQSRSSQKTRMASRVGVRSIVWMRIESRQVEDIPSGGNPILERAGPPSPETLFYLNLRSVAAQLTRDQGLFGVSESVGFRHGAFRPLVIARDCVNFAQSGMESGVVWH